MVLNTNKLVIAVSLILSGFFAVEMVTQLLSEDKPVAPSKIIFGSCADQNKPQPIWNAINKEQPDVFLFLGDNIYADTESREVFEQQYAHQHRTRDYSTCCRFSS